MVVFNDNTWYQNFLLKCNYSFYRIYNCPWTFSSEQLKYVALSTDLFSVPLITNCFFSTCYFRIVVISVFWIFCFSCIHCTYSISSWIPRINQNTFVYPIEIVIKTLKWNFGQIELIKTFRLLTVCKIFDFQHTRF